MKSIKAAGPSGKIVKMRTVGHTEGTVIRDLDTAIIRDGKVPI